MKKYIKFAYVLIAVFTFLTGAFYIGEEINYSAKLNYYNGTVSSNDFSEIFMIFVIVAIIACLVLNIIETVLEKKNKDINK